MAAMPAMANPHPHIATAAATAPTSRHEPETARHRELSLSHVIMANEPLAPLRCCCGRTECIFLQHNCTVLESVENDVRIAARLGQVRRVTVVLGALAGMSDMQCLLSSLRGPIGKLPWQMSCCGLHIFQLFSAVCFCTSP